MEESRILYTPRQQNIQPPRRKVWRYYAAFLIFAAIIGAAVYVLRLPELQVREIRISGLEVLREEEIGGAIRSQLTGAYAFLIPRSSLLLIRSKEIEERLTGLFPRIKTIEVRREFLNTLTIMVEERQLWGIFCVEFTEPMECVYIDKTGFAYETAPSSTGALILKIKKDASEIKVGTPVLDPALIETMEQMKERLQEMLGLEIIGFELFSQIPSEIRAKIADDFEIYLNRDDDLEKTLRVIKRVLDEEIGEGREKIEYIDARFGNKVFYRLLP